MKALSEVALLVVFKVATVLKSFHVIMPSPEDFELCFKMYALSVDGLDLAFALYEFNSSISRHLWYQVVQKYLWR